MKYFLVFLALLLVACETTPDSPEAWIEREKNACLPTAIIFKKTLTKYDVWARVFRYSWRDEETGKMNGHAMVAYLYPPGKNQLWTYDALGSFRTKAFTNNVSKVAQQAHWARGCTNVTYFAEWLD